MSYGKKAQNISGAEGAKVLPDAPVFQINQGEYQKRITGALRLAFVNDRFPVKKIAELADANEATAKNWWEGKSTPLGLNLLRLMATVPELHAEVRRLMAMGSDLDPMFEREMSKLVATFQRIQRGRP